MLMDTTGIGSPRVAGLLAQEVHQLLADASRNERNALDLESMGLIRSAEHWRALAHQELSTAWEYALLFATDRHRLQIAAGDRSMVLYGQRLLRFARKLSLDGDRAGAARVLTLAGQARREAVAR